MEKLTVARVGIEKVINYTNKKTGKPDSFKKVGILTNEYGDRWFDVTFRGDVPVKVGQSYDFEVKEREYVTKDGETRTAYNAELSREAKGGLTDADKSRMTELENKLTTLTLRFNKLMRVLVDEKVLKMPPQTVPGTDIEYPEDKGPTAFNEPEEAGIDPADIPFD